MALLYKRFIPMRDNLTRRQFLPGLGAMAALPLLDAAVALSAAESPATTPSDAPRKLRVVVTGGHPGDPECACGGTIARYTDMGHDVVLLYLNRGDPSETASRPASDVRVKEATAACAILKARPIFADQIDAHAIVDAEHYAKFRRMLEAERPDIVFTHWPIDNHADHRAMFNLVFDAWNRLGRKFALYYHEVSNGEDTLQFAPTHYVDISEAEPRKRLACYAHASQAPDKFYALQSKVTAMRGIESGHNHAEGYVRQVQSPDVALPSDR
jgi:LmbE family N-acetylglucosaminyl deacetylase